VRRLALEALSRIRSLKKGREWDRANQLLDKEFQHLLALDPSALTRLSDTEILARLIRSESTLAVREKTLMVANLLKEAGDIAAAGGLEEESRTYLLKGLHLLLGVLAHEDVSDVPELVPGVDAYLSALGGAGLPFATKGLLMQHYERVAEFGKAEDMLFSMLEEVPDQPELREFGIAFYRRLQTHSDDALLLGNLPRTELDSGLAELKSAHPPA
jgi:Family of unknown function (DUF6483)